jgi:hypothetical protein
MHTSWHQAAKATQHCLTGCAIGEVLGMVIGTALDWNDIQTIILAVLLAFFFGYLLTMRSLLKMNFDLKKALTIAFAADTVSIAIMEITDNLIMLSIPGAMAAELNEILFWGALAFSLFVAFLAAWPANYYMMRRGKGHARVHAHHHH